ncbi:hypothetical protein ACFL6X_00665 [Candidatus Latescibacterota bacterium]
MAAHAQELDEEVMGAHLEFYVRDSTIDYGDAGAGAIGELLRRAQSTGLVPPCEEPLFT